MIRRVFARKSILFSALVIVCVGALVGAGVMAVFSDTETNGGNAFAAGTLDLKVEGSGNPVNAYFNISNAAPGDGGNAVAKLKNAGTLDGRMILKVLNVQNEPGNTPEPEPTPDNGELGSCAVITIKDSGGNVIASDTIDNLSGNEISLGPLSAGAETNVTVEWSIPLDMGNKIMGDSVGFDIEFGLVQYTT